MDAAYRIPKVKVIIKRPNWNKTSGLEEFSIVTFEPRPCTEDEKAKAREKYAAPQNYDARSDALRSYTYTESRQNEESSFTLSLTAEQDKNGLTWLDKLDNFDLVFIEEFGKIRYCGIIHRMRYSSSMTPEGPERNIMVEGNGFDELLKTFHLVMDLTQFIQIPAEVENLQAKSEFISKNDTSFEGAIKFYYDNFKKLTVERGSQQAILALIIEKYIRLEVDKNCSTPLPICQSMYQMGVNTLWDIVRKIVPEPMYELFGRWDTEKNKYIIIARQSPFRPLDWKSLPTFAIRPVTLKEINLGLDDSDVFTAYYGTAPSFGYTKNITLTVDSLHKNIKVDEERWKKYGYRPLNVEFSFLKRDNIDPNDVEASLKEIGELLESWYKNNDHFLSGIISIISHEDDKKKYPAVGCRLEIIGGEFYIDEITRKWDYGKSPTSDINVIRGGRYAKSGEYEGPLKGLGKRLAEVIG
jgi:hypothetical protein